MRARLSRWAWIAVSALGGCTSIVGLDDLRFDESSAAGGGAGQGGDSSSAAETGSLATGPLACSVGESRPCYTGPPETLGEGICVSGEQACDDEGLGFGPCVGELIPKAEDCTTIEDEDCDGSAPLCLGSYLWGSLYGDASPQQGNAAAVGSAGDLIVAGQMNGDVDFGVGLMSAGVKSDAFVAKLSPSGAAIWSRSFGDGSDQAALGVAIDPSGSVIVTGEALGAIDFGGGTLNSQGGQDVFVAKLDAAGNHLWSARFGDALDQRGEGVAVDPQGNVVVVGRFGGTLQIGASSMTSAGGDDAFIVKLDGAGQHLWSKRIGDAAPQSARSVATDSVGNILVAGTFLGSVDVGNAILTSAGGTDALLLKLDPLGNTLWSRQFGDPAGQSAEGVAVGPGDVVAFTGAFQGSVNLGNGPHLSAGGDDAFVALFSPAGQLVWSKSLGGAQNDVSRGVAVDSAGNLLLAGSLQGTVDFGGGKLVSKGGDDAFLVKLDPLGKHLWSKHFGGLGAERALGVCVSPAGDVSFTGAVGSDVDLGGGSLVGAGGDDILVGAFGP